MSGRSILRLTLAIVVVTALGAGCPAQEVGTIDLTTITDHKDLRRPPLTQSTSAVRGGSDLFDHCRYPAQQTGALRTELLALDRTHYQIGDQPIFEVSIENTGFDPLKIPFSPHLAELQPRDPAKRFAYWELQLVLWIGAPNWAASTGGTVALYGADDHPGTMLRLNPGEWARIIGKDKLALPQNGIGVDVSHAGEQVDHAFAKVTLYRDETLLTATAIATVHREVCFGQTEGRGIPIAVVNPEH